MADTHTAAAPTAAPTDMAPAPPVRFRGCLKLKPTASFLSDRVLHCVEGSCDLSTGDKARADERCRKAREHLGSGLLIHLQALSPLLLAKAIAERDAAESAVYRLWAARMFDASAAPSPGDCVEVKERHWMGMSYPACFVGGDAIEWVISHEELLGQRCRSTKDAEGLLHKMGVYGYVVPLSSSELEISPTAWYCYNPTGIRPCMSRHPEGEYGFDGVIQYYTKMQYKWRHGVLVTKPKEQCICLYSTSLSNELKTKIVLKAVASVVWASVGGETKFELHTISGDIHYFRCISTATMRSWVYLIEDQVREIGAGAAAKQGAATNMVHLTSSGSLPKLPTADSGTSIKKTKQSARDCEVRSGRLMKKTEAYSYSNLIRSPWRERVVILVGPPYYSMRYYNPDDLHTPKGDVDLRNAKSVEANNGGSEAPYQITVTTASGKQYFFNAMSPIEQGEWVEDIKRCIRLYQEARNAKSTSNPSVQR
eukprot:TRINITY_DN8894_c0_g1_i1.p1 TRINITY_DN8894_c0_g1~~TRINITY_DN8894_c0_g1_i1.p1  ORF type:complete len:493 (+),score=101.16 TRINITY_DN8894_c0_g1_i1:38-1480(+)